MRLTVAVRSGPVKQGGSREGKAVTRSPLMWLLGAELASTAPADESSLWSAVASAGMMSALAEQRRIPSKGRPTSWPGWWPGLLALASCAAPPAALVEVSAETDVPRELTALEIEVHQAGALLAQKRFDLHGTSLPQSVWLEAHGSTSGTVELRVAGLRQAVVEARGTEQGALSRQRPPPTIQVNLKRLCAGAPDGGMSCGCIPGSCGDPGLRCGELEDGCGGTLDCGACAPPLVCGLRSPNVCGSQSCQPRCKTCGEVDPACGELCTSGECAPGQYCDGGSCACPQGMTDCFGQCRNLQTDPANCGTCGHACPNAKPCAGGACLCTEPSDNVDGHCCPAGMSLLRNWYGREPYCYLGPRGPADLATAEADCKQAIGYACFGGGLAGGNADQMAAPQGACGSHLQQRGNGIEPRVVIYSTGGRGAGSCEPGCDAGCQCSGCTGGPCWGCVQPYYCVLDPLGPRRERCAFDGDCPPGTVCKYDGGCQPSGTSCCARQDCAAGQACVERWLAVTGLCR